MIFKNFFLALNIYNLILSDHTHTACPQVGIKLLSMLSPPFHTPLFFNFFMFFKREYDGFTSNRILKVTTRRMSQFQKLLS